MFVTTTLDSYGSVHPDGTAVDPATYDYRRAVLDALHFPKLVDRLIQNLRRCAGSKMEYFGCLEAQKRLAPHLHMALRGVIPRQLFKEVVAATYHQMWWLHRHPPARLGGGRRWLRRSRRRRAVADLGPGARPNRRQCHRGTDARARFGKQTDYQGLLGGSRDSEYRVGYLCKYVTKSIADHLRR